MATTHTHFVHYIKCGPGPTCYGARVHWKFMVVFDRQNVSLDEKQSFIKSALWLLEVLVMVIQLPLLSKLETSMHTLTNQE